MEKEKYYTLFNDPSAITASDIVDLKQVVKDYPYFHNAHLLLLYGLKITDSNQYEEQLRQSALNLSSRSVLLHALINGWPLTGKTHVIKENVAASKAVKLTDQEPESPADLSPVAEPEAKFVEEIPEPANFSIQELSAQQTEPLNMNSEPVPETETANTIELSPFVEEETKTEEPAGTDTLAQKSEKPEEKTSFLLEDSQPIEISDNKPESVETKTESTTELLEFDLPAEQQEDEPENNLIDSFLKTNPRIVPRLDLNDQRGDISMPSLEENDEFVTETLAIIFEQQGLFAKAKEAYEKLILKFPEKSTYFASRIQELNNLIK